MRRTQFIAIALAGAALAAAPTNAGGLLGGGVANCLCQAAPGLAAGGSGAKATSIGRGIRGTGQRGIVSGGPRSSSRAIGGNVTGSVNSTLNVTVARSIDRGSGHMTANAGLLGKVRGGTARAGNFNGVGRSVGLAGRTSTQGSINSWAGVAATGLQAKHTHGLAGKPTSTLNTGHGKALGAGQLANVSVLNKTGTTGRPAINVAVLNGTGGRSGKVTNVSVLNKTGTTGRSAVNVAALNGSGGTSGKVINVAALNKTGTTGRSLVNASVLNGSAGGTGQLANVSALNGRHGKGYGSLSLPKGVQIINGVPCGPDGTPLTGASAASIMAMISASGGHSSGSGKGSGGSTSGNSGNGSAGADGAGSNSGSATAGGGTPRERDMADRKDLWWPPQPQRQSRDGRLNDH